MVTKCRAQGKEKLDERGQKVQTFSCKISTHY